MVRVLLLAVFGILATFRIQAQGFGATRIQYVNPGSSNDLELISEIMIPSQPAFRINHLSRIGSDTLYVEACYYSGIMGATITIKDTIQLGSVPPGITTLHFKIFTSLSTSQCNIINSATKIQAFGIAAPLGVDLVTYKNNLNVYPNPTSDFIFLNEAAAYSIILYDLTGKIMQRNDFQHGPITKLDLTSYRNGVYLLEIINREGKSRFQRIIKE